MKRSPEELEKLIHQTLRSLPERPAPRTLEERVFAAIDARAARPWWRQSFRQWPMAARIVFLLFSAGLVRVAVMAAVWVMSGFESSAVAQAFSAPAGWLRLIGAAFTGTGDFLGIIFRSIPPVWLYGGLACLAGLYLTLFGLSAAAYRTLYARR